ncbi:MAG: DUF2339 domain-containing protein [Planctomycetes bacterium]|nr:DUF2339 domain-containing protein [Planctomycetota bacterium]
MNQDDLKQQLKRLADRLDRVEQRLGLGDETRPAGEAGPDDVAARRGPPPTTQAKPTEPATVPPPRAPFPAAPPTAPTGTLQPPPVVGEDKPAVVALSQPRQQPATKRFGSEPTITRAPLELLIGGRWMAWVGAIVVVLGAGFLVKLGYDSEVWSKLSSLTQCLLVAGFGGLLVLGGEVVLRKVGRAASVGLFGAGLGTLYLDAFAAFEWFSPPLVSRDWALVLMAIVALVGFGITLHSAFVTIGILSIIGGYLTPWLLRGATTHTLEVGSYLTMLFGISLGLSAVRPKSFRALRYVALGGQGLIGLSWVLATVRGEWITALVFITIWWAIVLLEVVVAALREQSTVGNAIASLLSTVWFVTIGCWVLARVQPPGFDWLGSFTVAVAVIAAAVAAQFGPGLGALRDRPRTAMDKLAIALWAQAGVLLAVAVALQFDGYGQSIGWLAIAVAAIEIGRRLPSRGVDIFGLIVGAVALARVSLLDWWLVPAMKTQLWSIGQGQVNVTNWSILALVAILATHLAARRLRQYPQPWRIMPILLAGLATLGWMGLCVTQCRQLTITGGWLLASVVLLAAERVGRRQRYFEIGLLVLLAAACKWLMIDAAMQRLDPGWDPTARWPLLNWQMGLAVAIAGAGWWAARLLARRSRAKAAPDTGDSISTGWQVVLLGGAAFFLIALSFELNHTVQRLAAVGRTYSWSFDQLWQLFLTLLWTMGSVGVGLLARSMMRRGPSGEFSGPHLLVRFAWVLLTLCAVKWLVADTLYWAVFEESGRTIGAWPVANIQMLVGAVLVASAMLLYGMAGLSQAGTDLAQPDATGRSPWVRPGAWVPVAAAVLVLWGLTFEVDRALGRFTAARGAEWEPLWNPLHLRALLWTLLWAAGGLAMMLWTRLRPSGSILLAGWFVVVLAAVAWLGYDTLGWRIAEGVVLARVVFNVQFAVGALLAGILAVGLWRWSQRSADTDWALKMDRHTKLVGWTLIGLIGLWLGSLEIDRFLAPEAGRLQGTAAMARQTWLSIYCGLYAIALMAVGFAKRQAACRYAGLALLTITVAKVLTVDMAEVRYVYRVLSLLGVGLLLVATSIGYAKLAPRLLASSSPSEEAEQ